jgi:hypothetical protein
MTAELFVALLKHIMRRRRKPLFLVVDSLPAHKAKMVRDYVESTNGELELHFRMYWYGTTSNAPTQPKAHSPSESCCKTASTRTCRPFHSSRFGEANPANLISLSDEAMDWRCGC